MVVVCATPNQCITRANHIIKTDAPDRAALWMIVRELILGKRRIREDQRLARAGRDRGPAMIGGTKERDQRHAHRRGDVAWPRVIGHHDGRPRHNTLERTERDTQRTQPRRTSGRARRGDRVNQRCLAG